jgi:hypothetical protein
MSGTAERKTRVLPVHIRRSVVAHRVIPRRLSQRSWLGWKIGAFSTAKWPV